MLLPARTSSGGVKSTPAISPLAIDGAAVMMTMNKMAGVLLPNRMIAKGIQTTDGMVCKPVIIDPTAARTGGTRATSRPTRVPMTRASAKPMTARRNVVPMACQSCPWFSWLHRPGNTWPGPGRMSCGFTFST